MSTHPPILNRSLEIARALYSVDFGGRRCWHLSLLFERSKLLLIAENSTKTHARNIHNNQKAKFDLGKKQTCSEMVLFRRAKNKFANLKWNRWTLVNIRIDALGQVKNSYPCVHCENLLIDYLKIKKLYYTTEQGDFEKLCLDPIYSP